MSLKCSQKVSTNVAMASMQSCLFDTVRKFDLCVIHRYSTHNCTPHNCNNENTIKESILYTINITKVAITVTVSFASLCADKLPNLELIIRASTKNAGKAGKERTLATTSYHRKIQIESNV